MKGHNGMQASFSYFRKATKPDDTTVQTVLLAYTAQNEVFCAGDDMDTRAVVCVDDGSEVAPVRAGMVLDRWATSTGERINITGIGVSKDGIGAHKLVTVHLRL